MHNLFNEPQFNAVSTPSASGLSSHNLSRSLAHVDLVLGPGLTTTTQITMPHSSIYFFIMHAESPTIETTSSSPSDVVPIESALLPIV